MIKSINIISYLPQNNLQLKKARQQGHSAQLDWAVKNNLNINVVAQCYDDTDYDSRVNKYHKYSTKLGPSGARNILLKEFYNSDENFAIFADDDCYLSSPGYGVSDEFITEFNKLSIDDLTNINCFAAILPILRPYKKTINNHTSWVFEGSRKINGAFLVIRNFKKYYGTEYYFNEESVAGEDMEFCLDLLNNGVRSHICSNIVAKLHNQNESTSERLNDYEQNKTLERLFNKYPDMMTYRICNAIGYSVFKNGRYSLRFNETLNIKQYIKFSLRDPNPNLEDVIMYPLPKEMTMVEAANYMLENSTDSKLVELLSKRKVNDYICIIAKKESPIKIPFK